MRGGPPPGEYGFGPFVTLRVLRLPDETVRTWESRWDRKHLRGPVPARAAGWAPRDRGWWIAVLFAIGSALFGLGAVPSYATVAGAHLDALTYFTGSLFFTSAAFLQYREAVDAALPKVTSPPAPPVQPASTPRHPGQPASTPRHPGQPGPPASTLRQSHPATQSLRKRFFVFRPSEIGWLGTVVQLAGTIAFNVSTAAAIVAVPGTAQEQHHVWRPDVIGSACFLVASALAWFEACHGWAAWRPRSPGWWITGVNLTGSVAFGVSAVASYVAPGSSQPLSARLADLGTFAGAVCFLAGAILLLPERAEHPAAPPPAIAAVAQDGARLVS